jgi:hypothetical protein
VVGCGGDEDSYDMGDGVASNVESALKLTMMQGAMRSSHDDIESAHSI